MGYCVSSERKVEYFIGTCSRSCRIKKVELSVHVIKLHS